MNADLKNQQPRRNRTGFTLTITVASLCAALPACKTTQPPPPQGLVAVRRIELGSELFVPGGSLFASDTDKAIEKSLADVPKGSRLRVEVFGDSANLGMRHTSRSAIERLSSRRAATMREYLQRQGFSVVMAVGRGLATVDGRRADRRVDVFVLK